MQTFAYCSQSFGHLMSRVAGASPTLCPPVTMETFEPHWLEGHDLVFFKLHGLKGQPYWYGDDHITALSAGQLAPADGSVGPDLQGAVVFVANCWLTDSDGTPGPMLEALFRAGPTAIIGGSGPTYALRDSIGGPDLLGLYLRYFLQLGFPIANAFRLAKVRLQLNRPDRVTQDTLGFKLYRSRMPPVRSSSGDTLVGPAIGTSPTQPSTCNFQPSTGCPEPARDINLQTFKTSNLLTLPKES